MNKQKIIVVVGPTASGKTELAIRIAEHFSGEIVSADSMQIYKDIPIASAAPSAEEMKRARHHLVAVKESHENYSVADYVTDARLTVTGIVSRGHQPIIVGGTGLYVDSLINGIEFTESKFDPEYRKRLCDEYDMLGGEEMLKKLSLTDRESAEKLKPNDKKRIIRAFEIYKETGLTVKEQNEKSRENGSDFDAVIIGLNFDNRDILYGRINERVEKMLEEGLLEEAKKTYKAELSGCISQAIGHKEFYPYFEGKTDLASAVEELKKQTRRYAKRQITWFRRNERINWIYPDLTPDVFSEALKILERNGFDA